MIDKSFEYQKEKNYKGVRITKIKQIKVAK